MNADPRPPVLAGFWSGGFEGADHVNAAGVPLDLVHASGHWRRLDDDHARAAGAGLSSVRESIGWRLSESASGVIDLSRAQRVAESAHRHGLQVLWTLMHYGIPAGLSLHDDAFVERFARFAAHVAKAVGTPSDRAPVFTPINEMGFLAWAASQAHLLHAPDNTLGFDDEGIRGRGYDVKCRLVRASLLGMHAMRAEDPRCIFMHAEPLVHVVAPVNRPDLASLAQRVSSWQWQVWDLLTGVERPELGGHPGSVDLMGLNHYHNSQWELGSFNRLEWHLQDPRRKTLSSLLGEAWLRYQKPLMLAETSHVGSGRAAWLHEMAGEVRTARALSLPVNGVCLYPLMDRPDWSDTAHWHRSGQWHVDSSEPDLPCALEPGCAAALQSWQQHLPTPPADDLPLLVVLCHRRWGITAHRTQQLVKQLAAHWRVLWVEEPRASGVASALEFRAIGPTIDVLIPQVGPDRSGWASTHPDWLLNSLRARFALNERTPAVVWLTDPMALALARALDAGCLVIDCCGPHGDDGTAVPWDAGALRSADVVFTEGEAKARRLRAMCGRAVHPIPNGVDLQQFTGLRLKPDLTPQTWAAMEAQSLQGACLAPRVGYAGAIDARLDTELIACMAAARPDWNFVMVGPVVGIDAGTLPQAVNIAWLGEQPHELLPELMQGWNVGWLPWRTGAASVEAHPAQVLEYLACGLPVVSPWLSDLAPLAPAGILWACTHAMHLSHCDTSLAMPAARRQAEQRMARQLLQRHGWSDSARRLEDWVSARSDSLPPALPRMVLPDLRFSDGAGMALINAD